MVCLCPKVAYQRKFYPIDGNISERNLKRLNKISFQYHRGWKQILIPCGECPACKLAKANEWAVRINNEAETWKNKGIFVTLTYNTPNLPLTKDGLMTLQKRDMQLFKKRLRKYISKHNEGITEWINPKNGKIEKPIRTFECGEYGPTKGRPHYHQIIFNWIPNDLVEKEISKDGYPLYKSKTLQKIWGKGFVLIGMISFESASYVARYTMKKAGLAKTKRVYYDACEYNEETKNFEMKTKYKTEKGEIEPEFITMSTSPGIGYCYFIKNQESIIKNNGLLIKVKGKVKLKSIPRYYRKIMERQNWKKYEKWKYENQKQADEKQKKLVNSYKLPEEMIFELKVQFVNNIFLDTIRNKFNLLKRNNILYDEETKEDE